MQPSKQDEPRVWTVGQVLKWTQERFASARLASPRLDAELLLCQTLGWPRMSLYTKHDQPMEAAELARFRDLIRRRLAGESVAYLIGQKEFWSLTLRVSPAVLVPRPETETLVEAALALLDGSETTPAGEGDLTIHYDEIVHPEGPTEEELAALTEQEAALAEQEGGEAAGPAAEAAHVAPAVPAQEPAPSAAAPAEASAAGAAAPAEAGPLIADIGTGSGAVALALKKERPAARLVAVDVSPDALAVARDNAERLGLEVELLEGDLLAPLEGHGRFDLIVSNPPYIPSGDLPGLPPEVRAEPARALDGGADGLAVIRRLVSGAASRLRPGGALAMEVGDGQAPAVMELLARAGYVDVAARRDLGRTPRVVFGRRPA